MELHFSRSQKSGMLGGVKFILSIKLQLTPEEQANADRYGLGAGYLYEQGDTRIGAGVAMKGTTIECKSVVEMMSAEIDIKAGVERLSKLLKWSERFEGEEVHSFA
jgi:hypothetical protein